jgi:hypothetical protein
MGGCHDKKYQSIINNDVWEVFPRQNNKYVVSSKWIYKIKHVANESIEKHKEIFVARGFIKSKVLIMKRLLLL